MGNSFRNRGRWHDVACLLCLLEGTPLHVLWRHGGRRPGDTDPVCAVPSAADGWGEHGVSLEGRGCCTGTGPSSHAGGHGYSARSAAAGDYGQQPGGCPGVKKNLDKLRNLMA